MNDIYLKELLENGKIVIILNSVSKSGMSRIFDLYYISGEKLKPLIFENIKVPNLKILDTTLKNSIKVVGCGMDMAFFIIDELRKFLNLDFKNYKFQAFTNYKNAFTYFANV
ncbi:hypothetical protein FTT16_08735 [Campylobacter jejuni]|nr:hypothetical protein [Campylobacter jejuni]